MPSVPRLARRLLERRLPEPSRTYLLGDLQERYIEMAHRSSARAWLWYWRQALLALLHSVPGPVGLLPTTPRDLGRTLAHATRSLWRRPGTALLALLPLGLGIGVVATAFSIAWGTVLAGLPFEDAHRLVHFERVQRTTGEDWLAVTPHDYVDWRAEQRSFEDLGAYVEREIALPSDAGPPERRVGVAISAGSFPLLRAEPTLGRTFTADDEEPGAPEVILLSHGLWTARFAADPGIVGQTVEIDGRPTTVVGVMPAGFGFPIAEEFWLPLRLDLSDLARGEGRLDVFGRLRDGVSLGGARDEFGRITEGLATAYPESNTGIGASLRSFEDEYIGEAFRSTVYRLMAGALLVLLVCCANVANLLLVRGFRRRHDLAVRQALGASRGAVVSQLLLEAMVLSGLGALLGVALARFGVSWFNRAGTGAGVLALPHGAESLFWWDVSLNPPTLLATFVATGLAAGLAGAAPAFLFSGSGLLTSRGSMGRGRGQGLQRMIVASQLALTAALLVTAGFVGRSVGNVADTLQRFVVPDVTVMGLALPSPQGDAVLGHEGHMRFIRALEERLAGDPSVASAAFTTAVPLQAPREVPVALDARGDPAAVEREAGIVAVSPGYFDTFGVEALDGRLFSDADGPVATPVALVNQSFARRHFPERSPVGARIRLGAPGAAEPWIEVVGVVPDLWSRPDAPERNAGVYVPLTQTTSGDLATRLGPWGAAYPRLAVRAAASGSVDASLLGRHVAALDPSLPVRTLDSMEGIGNRMMGRYQVWGRFWLAFAVAALLLAALGIYGVLSFVVSLRTAEIGIRRALGASSASVQRGIVLAGMKDLVVGLMVGLAMGKVLTDGLGQILYGVEPGDPRVFLLVAMVVGTVGLTASWLPARRAARIDPRDAIRAD